MKMSLPSLTQLDFHVFGKTLQTLKSLSTKKEKQEELSKFINGTLMTADLCVRQRLMWVLCLDPLHTFGITDVPEDCPVGSWAAPDECPLVDLINRTLTGNAALAAVCLYYKNLETTEAKHGFRAIIRRRPDCGVSAKTVNAVRPGFLNLFQVMLAKDWDEKKVQKLIDKGGALVEPKFDGERRIAINLDGQVSIFSRDGRRDEHFPELIDLLKFTIPENHVFDGELFPRDNNFNRLASMTRSKATYTLSEANIAYIVFDHMPLADWADSKHLAVQRIRTATLADILAVNGAYVRRARSTHVGTLQEADDLYLHYLDQGLEGVILKDPNALYAFKRNNAWIKRKVTATVDLVVQNLLPGDPGKQFENSLGRIVCNRNGVEVHVAPGKMSHEERQQVWDAGSDHTAGRVIEVAYQEETPDGSLRHPRFIRWRDDK